jgi:hypothetical protein
MQKYFTLNPSKTLLALVATMAISPAVFAQEADESGGQSTATVSESSANSANALNGLSFAAGYSFANEIQLKSPAAGEFKYETDSAPSLAARFGMPLANDLSLLLGGTYEFERKINSVTRNGSTFKLGNDKPGFSILLVEPNIAYSLTKQIFAFGGANYPVVFRTGQWSSGFESRGELGAQLGVGYLPIERLSVELLYRTMNMTFESASEKTEYVRSWGPQLRMSYTL